MLFEEQRFCREPGLLHGSDETIPALGQCLYVMAVLITENSTQHRDTSREAAFLDKSIAPDAAQQLVLLKRMPGVCNQRQQRVVGHRRERHRLISAEQPAFDRVDTEGAEFVEMLLLLGHSAV